VADPLKDHFDQPLVDLLAERFASIDPDFDPAAFVERVMAGFPALELKNRINLIADELRAALPDDYPTALAIVVAVAETDGIEGFTAWPLCSFVERHGLADPPASLVAMESLTRRFSCEFAIRPFLEHHLELTLTHLHRWIRSDDETVRRLPSEGTRPHLPWGPKVDALLDDPEIGIAVLTELRHDPSETVRRSVANHLNDLARNHPQRVVEITREWSDDPEIEPTMIRHALRSLVKRGDRGALGVLGFTTEPEVSVVSFGVAPAVLELSSSIELELTLVSDATADQRLVVDFVIHHVGVDGTARPKVFKWTTVDLAPGATVSLTKRRRIATASTRRYHAGRHRVDLQIAGQIMAETAFDLLDSSAPE
jgi:3-methyladenine DNA glycosylase AlkC